MIGLAGLLNLLEVVSRLQATQQQCACASQEAGVPCLGSPPDQTIWPALPAAFVGAPRQSLGPVAAGQSAPASAPARSPRRTAVPSAGAAPAHRRRGGQPCPPPLDQDRLTQTATRVWGRGPRSRPGITSD